MHSFKLVQVAAATCLAFAASACQEHSKQSLAMAQAAVKADRTKVEAAVKAEGAEVKAAAVHLDDYIGDRFSDAEKALQPKPETEPDAPTF